MKKKLTKQEKINNTIKSILNLEPILEIKIVELLSTIDEKQPLYKFKNLAKSLLKINDGKAYGIRTKQYWIKRGWDEVTSINNVNQWYIENPRDKSKSPFNMDYWLNKGYTEEEANNQIKSRRSTNMEYWLNKGYTEEEAKEKLSKRQSVDFSNVAILKLKTNSLRTLSGWLNKGYTEEEAKEKLKNQQGVFSKKKCISKYGERIGLEKFNARQEKWQNTMNAKSDEEMSEINRRKVSAGYNTSKNEQLLFEYIKNDIPNLQTQFTLQKQSRGYYCYDIMYNNNIIEYNGDFWHMNPLHYNQNDINKRTKRTANEQWKLDKNKVNFAKSQGYKVLSVWESDFNSNKEKVIQECLNFLKQ